MINNLFNVVTYNILNPELALQFKTVAGLTTPTSENPSGNNWKTRKNQIGDNLFLSHFTVACLQELSEQTSQDLQDRFKEIGISNYCELAGLTTHRSENAKKAYGVGILYNSTLVDLIATKNYQSLTNRYWTRGEIYADFKDRKTQSIIRVASIHLLGYSLENSNKTKKESQFPGFQQLQDIVNEVEKDTEQVDSIVIAGDFNEGIEEEKDNSSSRYKYMIDHGYKCDGSLTPTKVGTTLRIDWIFLKILKSPRKWVVQPFKLQPLKLESQQEASDHHLTGTRITLVNK